MEYDNFDDIDFCDTLYVELDNDIEDIDCKIQNCEYKLFIETNPILINFYQNKLIMYKESHQLLILKQLHLLEYMNKI